jgi:hypothetical protein
MERSPSNTEFPGREPGFPAPSDGGPQRQSFEATGSGQFRWMGHGLKVTLCACCAAVAMVVSGAGYAAAAPVSLAAQRTAGAVMVPDSTRWDVSGDNSVDVTYDGTDFVYSVTFVQSGSTLSGTLDDSYYPTSGSVSGTVSGDDITFTFAYPTGSIQGTRTYTGTISSAGAVSGTWTQTGSESPDNGSWGLARNAVPTAAAACAAATAANDAAQADLKDAQSASEDDAARVSQDIRALHHAVVEIPGNIAEASLGRIKKIFLNSLDPEVSDINSDLADRFFQRAAAVESAEAAQVGVVLDIVTSKLIPALGLPALAVTSKDIGKLLTADAALKIALVRAEAAKTAAHAAHAAMERACS